MKSASYGCFFFCSVPQGVENSHDGDFFYLHLTIDMIVRKNAVHQSV
jgi:hypothetical protein